MEGASVSKIDTRERESSGGREEGIRLGDKAAGLKADLIVRLSFPSPSNSLQKHLRSLLSSSASSVEACGSQSLVKLTEGRLVRLCFALLWRSEFGFCYGTGVDMVVYLRKSIHSLLSVFKKKGECRLTWRLQLISLTLL